MTSVLLTAFEPYDRWKTNASQLCLQALEDSRPNGLEIATRVYPVKFVPVKKRLRAELKKGYDFVIHMGQAPGTASIRLESIGLNVGGEINEPPEKFRSLTPNGPVAYRTAMPLARWVTRLRKAGIPAYVSYHAGTYLCNAVTYWSHYLAESMGLPTQIGFVHLPLTTSQALKLGADYPSLPVAEMARAITLMLDELGT